MEDMDAYKNIVYETNNENIKVFQCRHPFHVRCLQKYNPIKLTDSDEVKKKKEDNLKCPECNKKNFDLDDESA
jgi:hypothetical protein